MIRESTLEERCPAEAGINPPIVKAEGLGVVAVDGLLVMSDNGN